MGGRRREGGRESRAITFLSPIGSGGKPQDVSRCLPESVAELLRGRARRPFKAVAGARAWTERSLPPPPPKSPRSAARASAEHDPLAQSPSAPSKRLLLLQRVGRREAPLGITGAGPEPRVQRGWGGGRRRGLEPRFEGRRGSPAPGRVRCSGAGALHPGAPLRGHVRRLPLLSSSVRSLSSPGSPRPVPGAAAQRDERLGRSEARVPCLRAEVLRESPSDPRRGAYAGWWASLDERAEAFRLRSRSPEWGGGTGGSPGGVRAPLCWLAGGLCVGRSEGLGSPLGVCLSPSAGRSSNKFCISAINFSHYICTNQRSSSSGPGAGLALKVVPVAGC